MAKILFRSSTRKIFGGVAAGLGEYFDIDPVIIRVLFAVSAFAGGLSVFVYLGLWMYLPSEYFVLHENRRKVNFEKTN
ncbi:MAG: PspC domain-containing protein [Candidatus Kapabacteria bacterium]|nr:PspC domain-containing protein [Candidatus Kapabacteria bacterium]